MKVNGQEGEGVSKGSTLLHQTSSLLIGRSPALACQPTHPPSLTHTHTLSAADGAGLLNSSQILPALCFPPCFFFAPMTEKKLLSSQPVPLNQHQFPYPVTSIAPPPFFLLSLSPASPVPPPAPPHIPAPHHETRAGSIRVHPSAV